MPCYDHRSTYEYGREEAKKELDALARVACEAFRALERCGAALSDLSEEAREWWSEHKAADEAS